MPKTTKKLKFSNFSISINIFYLEIYKPPITPLSDLQYLHFVRQPEILNAWGYDPKDNVLKDSYYDNINVYSKQLTNLSNWKKYDCILSPPSSLSHLVFPYIESIKKKKQFTEDLTSCFERKSNIKSGEGADIDSLIDNLVFNYKGNRSKSKCILFVDDVCATGKTASSIYYHLEKYFIDLKCFDVVVPLLIKKFEMELPLLLNTDD